MLEFYGAPPFSIPPLPFDSEQCEQVTTTDTLKSLSILTGALPGSFGSSLVEIGGTKVMAIVESPKPLPKAQQEASKGILKIKVIPSSVCYQYDTIESKQETDKAAERFEAMLETSFESVLLLERYHRMIINVQVHILGDHGNVFIASTAACSTACAQNQIEMMDLLVGISLSPNTLNTFHRTLNISYTPSLERIAAIYGEVGFSQAEFTSLMATLKSHSDPIIQGMKKSLLFYAQNITNKSKP